MRKIDFNFYRIYAIVLLGTTLVYSYFFNSSLGPRNIIDVFLKYGAFIPFFGFAYDKKLFNRLFWQIFAAIFFAWEVGRFFVLYDDSFIWEALIVIVLAPKYFSIIAYPLFTLEEDEGQKKIIQGYLEGLKTKVFFLIETMHIIATILACILMTRAAMYSLFHGDAALGIMIFCVVCVFVIAICFYRRIGAGLAALIQLLTVAAFVIIFNVLFAGITPKTYEIDTHLVEEIIRSIPSRK